MNDVSRTDESKGSTSEKVATEFVEIESTTYIRVYLLLKSQKTILESLRNGLDNITSGDMNVLDTVKQKIDEILNTAYGKLPWIVVETVPFFQELIGKLDNDVILRKRIGSLLSSVLSIGRIFTFLSSCMAKASYSSILTKEDKPQGTATEKVDNEDCVICRICEEMVPIRLIMEHSASCVKTFANEFKSISIDERITKLITSIQDTTLTQNWPGEETIAIGQYIPFLHLELLLDKANKVSLVEVSQEETDLLSMINSVILIIMKKYYKKPSNLMERAHELAQEKLISCSTYHEASYVAQQTRARKGRSSSFKKRVTIADFNFIKSVSSGAFARVFLTKKLQTGDIYAVKVTPKTGLGQKNFLQRLLTEKDILLNHQNPFIVNFYYSFIGKNNLYLVMEYLPGGDLYSLLQTVGSLDEISARTYTAQIIKALEYLHQSGIIHRDLKPDNMLISKSGNLKLTDFGLSMLGSVGRSIRSTKRIMNDSESIVGTPDYLPPEIVSSQQHDITADYWSLGAVVYEFLVGVPPFHGETETETFSNILNYEIDWSELEEFSPEARDFIHGLLQINPKKRLGANGIQEIMKHPWFASIDWDNIVNLKPPFVPEINDLSMGSEYFQERTPFKNVRFDDILEDIRAEKNISQSRSSMMIVSMNQFDFKPQSDDESVDEDIRSESLDNFSSISLASLSQANKSAALRHHRASSNGEIFSRNAQELQGMPQAIKKERRVIIPICKSRGVFPHNAKPRPSIPNIHARQKGSPGPTNSEAIFVPEFSMTIDNTGNSHKIVDFA